MGFNSGFKGLIRMSSNTTIFIVQQYSVNHKLHVLGQDFFMRLCIKIWRK